MHFKLPFVFHFLYTVLVFIMRCFELYFETLKIFSFKQHIIRHMLLRILHQNSSIPYAVLFVLLLFMRFPYVNNKNAADSSCFK